MKKLPEARPDQRYVCLLCDFRTNRKAIYHHIRNHVLKMECPICYEIIPNKHDFAIHIDQSHADKKKTLQFCEPCKLEFPNTAELIRHKKFSHNVVKCTFCPESMIRKKMVKHMRQFHELDLPTCEMCGFKSIHKSKVTRHKKLVHLKEKRMTCDVCKYQCFDTYALKKHMVRHEGEKSYECKFCKKKFARKTTCSMHEKIHTGEKNKVCELCGAAFVQKASLNYHMLKYHPDSVQDCKQ
ncbi:gastrula zinc finger protein XlCGF26.1-like [Cydia amplana]|uniref:gastrula zinc finger protein XlCGF26.1-like n=1 Tax=Cydia amplana TaxID=1869771 RepID=UPI002FE5C79D